MTALPDLMRRIDRKLDIQRGLHLSYDDLALLVASGAYARLHDAAEDEARANEMPEVPIGGEGDSHVYFIRAGGDGPIKIGRTRNATNRREALQSSTHVPLILLATIQAPHWAEPYFHHFYEDERIRGEWFRASPRLLAFIESLGNG